MKELGFILGIGLPLIPVYYFIEDLIKGDKKYIKNLIKAYMLIAGVIAFLILVGIMLFGTSIIFSGIYNTVKDLAIPVRVYHDQSTIDRP